MTGSRLPHHFSKRPASRALVLSLSVLSTLLSSCDSYLSDGIRVAWAKQLFQQGQYQEALLYSLDAEQNRTQSLKKYPNLNPDDLQLLSLKRIQYNIGLIYSALGQSRAAIERWQELLNRGELNSDTDLQFSILYNIGLLYSQVGQNDVARRNLVQALRLRPEHKSCRKALEIVLAHLKQNELGQKSEPKNSQPEELPSSQSSINDEQILNYISRQASYRFKSDVKAQQVLRNDW